MLFNLLMSRPLRIEYLDAWYHVMNRGGRYSKGVKSKAPVKAGKEQGVKVPRMVMDSDQPWPRVMRRLLVRGRRSVDRGRAGLAIELRNHLFRVADLVTWWGRQYGTSR